MRYSPLPPFYPNAMLGSVAKPRSDNAMANLLEPYSITSPDVGSILAQYSSPLPSSLASIGLQAGELEVPEPERRLVAWQNARAIPGFDPAYWRQDDEGYPLFWDAYGTDTEFGWHIHHRRDQELGGRHTRSNLVARQWRRNVSAGASLGAFLQTAAKST